MRHVRRMGRAGVFIMLVGSTACLNAEDAVECLDDADCAGGAVCVNGACEGAAPEGTDTGAESTDEGKETDICDSDVTEMLVPVIDDDECCADPETRRECWLADAARDGIACESEGDCLSGHCDTTRGVCGCSSQDDCDDGDNRQGYCVLTHGICGPSYCNGALVCSCWGGCAEADIPTPDEDEVCCEGIYSVDPDMRPEAGD